MFWGNVNTCIPTQRIDENQKEKNEKQQNIFCSAFVLNVKIEFRSIVRVELC